MPGSRTVWAVSRVLLETAESEETDESCNEGCFDTLRGCRRRRPALGRHRQFGHSDNGGYWAAYGIVAAAGLVFALAQTRGRDGSPPLLFLLVFLPVLVVAGWVLISAQPHGNWFRSHALAWSGDLGLRDVVEHVGIWLGVLAFGIGYALGLTLELPRRAAPVVVPVEHDRVAADEPVTAERREVEPGEERELSSRSANCRPGVRGARGNAALAARSTLKACVRGKGVAPARSTQRGRRDRSLQGAHEPLADVDRGFARGPSPSSSGTSSAGPNAMTSVSQRRDRRSRDWARTSRRSRSPGVGRGAGRGQRAASRTTRALAAGHRARSAGRRQPGARARRRPRCARAAAARRRSSRSRSASDGRRALSCARPIARRPAAFGRSRRCSSANRSTASVARRCASRSQRGSPVATCSSSSP